MPLPLRSAAALLLAGGLLLAAAPRATAQDAACARAFAPPRTSVDVLSPEVAFDFTYTPEQLAGKDVRRLHARYGVVLGLTVADLVHALQYHLISERLPGDETCVGLASVTASMGFGRMTVYVVRELDQEACLHGEVLRHEEHHVALHRQTLAAYAAIVRKTLAQAAAAVGQAEDPDPARARAALEGRLVAQVAPAVGARLAAWTAADRAANAAFDSPQEYNRLANSCGGRIRALLR